MASAYAIVSIHAPFCYLLGITSMELLRADGRSIAETTRVILRAMFRNSLMIGTVWDLPSTSAGCHCPGRWSPR